MSKPPIAKPKFTQEQIIAALVQGKGMVTHAARILECSPMTVHAYIRRNKAIRQAVVDERAKLVDTAELALAAAVANRQPWAIAFTLATLGRDRGYAKQSPGGSSDDPLWVATSPKSYGGFDPKAV